jgi:hypothetical protein
LTEQYIFRPAAAQEIQAVFDLIMGRVAWMDTVGIRQWNTTKYDQRYPLHYYEQRRQMDELFVLEERPTGEIVCVGALFHEDERWPDPESAFYLHHLASRVDKCGTGSIFLQLAEDYTAARGKCYLRLDSAVGNKTLEDYYTSRGYTECGRCTDGLYEGILRQKKLV